MGPPQLEPPGTVTEGQVPTKPICAGVKSPAPSQARSEPPQRRQMAPIAFTCARWMRPAAMPSPGVGHEFEWSPLRRASQHFCRAFDLDSTNWVGADPIARWQELSGDAVPNCMLSSAP